MVAGFIRFFSHASMTVQPFVRSCFLPPPPFYFGSSQKQQHQQQQQQHVVKKYRVSAGAVFI